MNIRSITGFVSPSIDWRALRDLFRAARVAFAAVGLPVQTTRLATQVEMRDLVSLARQLQADAKTHGIDYVSLGAFPGDHPLTDAIPAALTATETIFASAHIASHDEISFSSMINVARVMHQLAHTTADGFGNLRFAALANCPPHSPFFPAAYPDGGAPAFAIATEAAPLAVSAFTDAQNLDDARARLVEAIERNAATIQPIADTLAAQFHFRFAGIDFSLAPHPDESKSIGAAIEKLIGASFGEHGTLFAAAFITDCINRAKFSRAGFSGLFLPVLEDSRLAANSMCYTLDSLLLYSTVCGTGLDTIPLPGDTSIDVLAAILLDLATLAVKLNKPLTARLMPIPGLRAGDLTQFNFEYFSNARVMNANASALKIFGANNSIRFQPNHRTEAT